MSLLSRVVDNRGRTAPTADGGIPLIATNCIKDDALYPVFEKVRYISQTTYESWFRGHPQPGDIVFVCKGSPGRVALAPDPVGFCIAQDMVAVCPDSDRVYPKYLFAVLRSSVIRRRIENMHVGTLIPHFKKGDFGNLLIPLVDEGLQRLIGDSYYELSTKIESNRRAQQTGQQLVRALVRRTLDARAGDALASLGDWCRVVKEGVATEQLRPSDNYIGLDHMPRGSIFPGEWGSAKGLGSNKARFLAGDVLFGKLRPYFKKVGIAPVEGVCSTDILVIRPLAEFDRALVAVVASSDELINSLSAAATGTRMPRASWSDIASWPVPDLDENTRRALGASTTVLIDRLTALTHESNRLGELRDALLSEGISGRARMPEPRGALEIVV